MRRRKAEFITVEGIEGSGKSSAASYIVKYLRREGYSVACFKDPGATVIGEKIRAILLDKRNKKMAPHTELLLYLAARAQLIEEKIKHFMYERDFIVCDRFFDSTIVYQGHALKVKYTREAVKMFSFGIMPDLTLVLDVSPQKALKRIRVKDRIESREMGFHRKLREGYRKLASFSGKRIVVVDADKNLNDLFNNIRDVVAGFIIAKGIKPKGAR